MAVTILTCKFQFYKFQAYSWGLSVLLDFYVNVLLNDGGVLRHRMFFSGPIWTNASKRQKREPADQPTGVQSDRDALIGLLVEPGSQRILSIFAQKFGNSEHWILLLWHLVHRTDSPNWLLLSRSLLLTTPDSVQFTYKYFIFDPVQAICGLQRPCRIKSSVLCRTRNGAANMMVDLRRSGPGLTRSERVVFPAQVLCFWRWPDLTKSIWKSTEFSICPGTWISHCTVIDLGHLVELLNVYNLFTVRLQEAAESGKDDSETGSLMSCLILNKLHPDMNPKCRAGIEHHQLVCIADGAAFSSESNCTRNDTVNFITLRYWRALNRSCLSPQ